MRILITGGTGTLGRAVVPKLAGAGHVVRVLTRNPSTEGHVRGNLKSETGISEAVADTDAIVHLASAAHKPNTRRVDVDGTRRLLEAAEQAGTGHLLYVSIVGADRLPTRYMRFKHDAERAVMAGGVGWSILRATPFPEFTDRVLRAASRLGLIIVPARTPWQTADTGEVADRITAMIDQGPSRAIEDFDGPEIRPFEEFARTWLRARRMRRPILRAVAARQCLAGPARRAAHHPDLPHRTPDLAGLPHRGLWPGGTSGPLVLAVPAWTIGELIQWPTLYVWHPEAIWVGCLLLGIVAAAVLLPDIHTAPCSPRRSRIAWPPTRPPGRHCTPPTPGV